MGELVACVGETRNNYRISFGDTEREELCSSRTRRWLEDGIWTLKELGVGDVDSIHFA
jgi:hypothetical protein